MCWTPGTDWWDFKGLSGILQRLEMLSQLTQSLDHVCTWHCQKHYLWATRSRHSQLLFCFWINHFMCFQWAATFSFSHRTFSPELCFWIMVQNFIKTIQLCSFLHLLWSGWGWYFCISQSLLDEKLRKNCFLDSPSTKLVLWLTVHKIGALLTWWFYLH